MKRIITLLLSFAMLASILTACGGAASSQSSAASSAVGGIVTEQTDLTYIFADGDEAFKTYMNEIVDEFNSTYDNITVTIEPGDGGAYSELLKTKDSVGEFPDMMEMRDTAMYVRAGKLAPLSEELIALFNTTMDFGGQVYTAPMNGENTQGILYNKEYFEANKLSEPKTWDEFLELCKAIDGLGDMSPLVVGGQDIWHMGFWFSKVYTDNVLVKDNDFIAKCYGGTADFSDEKMVGTFEDLKDAFQYAQDGWASTPDAQITTFLVNELSAMMFSGTHMISQIYEADSDFNLGWFPVPDSSGKMNLVGGAGISGLALSAEAAKNPNKQAAFDEFVRFFFAKENYKNFLETMNYLPTTKDAPEIDGTEVYKTIVAAVYKADFLSPMWNGLSGENELPPDFRNFTYKCLVEVIQGSRTIESALEEMQKTWDVAAETFNPVTGVGLE